MNRVFLVVALLAVVAAPRASAAEQLHANVLAWSPNDVRPGEPVSVLLQLYTSSGSPYPRDGIPATAEGPVEVVLYGRGMTRRFPTVDRGNGRYYASIVFPANGGWDLRVDHGGGEIQLGKGGICIGAPICADELPAKTEDDGGGRAWIALVGAVVLLLAAAQALHPFARLRVEAVAEAKRALLRMHRQVRL